MKKTVAVKKIQDSRKLLRALENLTNDTKYTEEHFTDELYLFFQYLGRKVLSELDLEDPLSALFNLQPNNIIEKYWTEYEKIFSYYIDIGAKIGEIHYDILLEASKNRAKEYSGKSRETVSDFLQHGMNSSETNELFKPDPKVSSRLKRYKFEASEKTKSRVTEDINNILGSAYREGWGPRDVGEKIQERFNQLSGYEARRIAQTELNTTRNLVQYNRLNDDGMEYKIWHAAHDSRTRKSHLDVDEEIVPIGERFSNGLMYPGDKSGPIAEWVNCRCSHGAFIMPLGYVAPDFFPFTESDLVKVGSSVSSDYVSGIRERLGLGESIVQGAVAERERQKVTEEPIVESKPVETVKPKKPKASKPKQVKPEVEKPKPEPVNAEAKVAKVKLQDGFTKDFHTLVSQAEGTTGVELKPIYNKLKKKYKSKVKNRAEFEQLFTNAVVSTNTRLYPSRDPDLKVIFGKGTTKKGFGYIDRSKMRKPTVTEPVDVVPKKPKTKPKTEPTVDSISSEVSHPYSDAVEEHMDNFEKKARTQKVEYLQFYTDDGLVSPLAKGNWGEVRTTGAQQKWLEEQTKKGKKIHATHNHPTEYKLGKGNLTLLSDGDHRDFMGKNYDGINLVSLSAEGPDNRYTIYKLDNFDDHYKTDEQRRAIDRVDGYNIRYVKKYYENSPELKMLREIKADLKAQGIDWRTKMRESPEWWESIQQSVKEKVRKMREKDHARLIKKSNEILNPVGLAIESSPRK